MLQTYNNYLDIHKNKEKIRILMELFDSIDFSNKNENSVSVTPHFISDRTNFSQSSVKKELDLLMQDNFVEKSIINRKEYFRISSLGIEILKNTLPFLKNRDSFLARIGWLDDKLPNVKRINTIIIYDNDL